MGILSVTTPASTSSSSLRKRRPPTDLSAAGSDDTGSTTSTNDDDNNDDYYNNDDVKDEYYSTTMSTPRVLARTSAAADTPTALAATSSVRGGSSLDVGCGVSPCAAKAMQDLRTKNGSKGSRVRFSFSSSSTSDNDDMKNEPIQRSTRTARKFPQSRTGSSYNPRWSSSTTAVSFFVVLTVIVGAVHVWHNRSYQYLVEELEDVKQSRDVHQRNLIKARKAADELATFNDYTHKQLLGLKETQQHLTEHVTTLQHRISMNSYEHVLKKYGKGPHRVLFQLNLPLPNNEFILELAPLDRMPHSNHVFLEGVNNNIWNGKAAFWINAGHIIQAGSSSYASTGDDSAQQQTTNASYEQYSVSFREYMSNGDEFQHEAWTAGFAGHPGGPDFYINKRSNVEHHGPNTQPHHKLDGDADPCFARVISGFDTLRVIDSSQTKENSSLLEQPIRILHAKII